MHREENLYNAFFKAQDRFIQHHQVLGFEPETIQEYIQSGLLLASFYRPETHDENDLLYELFLRQVFFHLLDAIQDPIYSRIFRRICLDSIHIPLLTLKRYYRQLNNGDAKLTALQQQLRSIQTILD
ncbi:hypothetical protein [Vibrio gazogenes]|uniref:Uncharacterized protein n=1 Tax=Vibrio gazogenes DSM 21264 = NBRC 103151 TaxID=1123492 RepID=A0A1M5E422_VIBGA|nr:hypothetical protein [Vibrio gazogenes]USP15235.1 hypothetical protein MKS89_03185 [Vibrio gazogenes]SHF73963.1 hypothetical protein SAMN02745781_03042 [Vibrio gazogenes DSM 21264] [Vibrio gazogenes DSM 21264 = NBRC 103151]